MKGSFVYDIVTTLGIIIMVFLVIYWALIFGTETVAGMLLTSPAVVQSSIASAMSFGCRTENFTFAYTITKAGQFDFVVAEKFVQAIPPAKKLRDWTSIERGGVVQYRGIEPSPIITCERPPIPSTKTFSSTALTKIGVVKNSTFFGSVVR